jgi:DNA-binding LytR/AlgR family response regulator
MVYNGHRMWRRIRGGLAIWGGWTALALFFAVSASLTYRSTGRPANWSLSIERSLVEWWLWAAFTPIVVWLARRVPLDRARLWRHAPIHVAAGLIIAFAKTSAERAAIAWLTGFWTYWLVSTLALEFFVYCAIVAAAHGLVYYQRSRERDQLEARLTDVRLQLLSMQLQPHFLFNTLNTIAELVHDDPDRADYMIAGLSLRATRRYPSRVAAWTANRFVVIDWQDVDWAEAADNYVKLHMGVRELLVRATLASIERQLDPERFARIHRSAIVQLDRIAELHPASHGDVEVVLRGGTRLMLTRTWRERVQRLLGPRPRGS